MNKELYVSTTPHETKVALVEDDQLAEVYFERENEYTLAGSIYKGRVTRVLPGMQSAFVDIGLERDAFLYVSDFLELQDEDEDGEFGDVKVTGATLAQANGLILAAPQAVEEEEEPEEPREVEAAAAETEGDRGEESKDAGAGAPRWRGRRRRRGRRGGRERVAGDNPVEAQPGASDSEEWKSDASPSEVSEQVPPGRGADAGLPREPRKRELRGFEPRGLVVHGLARAADAEEVGPEAGTEDDVDTPTAETVSASPAASAYTPMLLPGESISKYNRADGEAPAPAPAEEIGASEDSDRGFSRGRDRDRDRGGRGRRGDRDRDRGRGRERDREREPREQEAVALPQNYTPIVLPGESISKYRGVEPAKELVEASGFGGGAAAPENPVPVEADTAAPVEHRTAPRTEENPDEPLSSASYSGASGLPSLTQRYAAEVEEPEPAAEPTVGLPPESGPELVQEEFAAAAATELSGEEPSSDIAAAAAVQAEPVAPLAEVHSEEAQAEVQDEPEAGLPEKQAKPAGRRSWRGRVTKTSGAGASQPEGGDEAAGAAQEVASASEVSSSENQTENQAGAQTESVEKLTAAPYEAQMGSFVIEGGHVEHEELDEDETEMPALAEHFDLYEASESEGEALDDGSGSQFGTAVRETSEESDLENEEYDFGGEEFEESELLAGEADEEEEGDEDEREAPDAVAAPDAGRPRPERFDRRERRGRRGAPPPRGGGRMHPRQQSRALPLISELLKEGQEILVQIAKEPIGKKGARITSHIALPGRFLVYMPTVNHIGVSRKISSEEERQRLKRIVSSERENGHGGFIVRTAASNIKEDELRADIRFLKHLWTEIRTRAESSKSPSLIYHDLNLVERILRDQVTSDFSQIWVDNESEYERVVRFASRFQPSLVRRIKLYTKDTPLYEQFGINEEINKSLKSKVWLKSGGYIVINQTEALVAIDINTGKYVGKTARLEDTIVKTNCDAVKEIVRQIRLRDLGGIIVVDFIDMDERKNRQKVMQALEEAMKADRAPSKILQFNDFGLVAITRKRVKQSLERTLGTPCPYCDSTGFVKSVQTVCNEIYVEMRKVRRHVESKEVILRVNPEVAKELKGGNGKWLQEMEELLGHPVLVKSDAQLHQEKFDMNY
jgi:Rne/Rng family ribonuclease